jgi:purine-binding chemotaxis protein CheW
MNNTRSLTNRYGAERPDPQKSLVGFVVGETAYAVPISCVREIVNPIPLTELPHAPRAVIGVVDHRGEVITVIDLRAHFEVVTNDRPQRAKWILVHDEHVALGLIVDRVTDVFGTAGQKLRDPPRVAGTEERGFLGVFSRDGVLTFVLDVQRFSKMARAVDAERQHALGLA